LKEMVLKMLTEANFCPAFQQQFDLDLDLDSTGIYRQIYVYTTFQIDVLKIIFKIFFPSSRHQHRKNAARVLLGVHYGNKVLYIFLILHL
jgi:hypothetical protein